MSISTQAAAEDSAARLRRMFFGPLTRLLNPYITRHGGIPGTALVGLVSHQGRRSGHTFTTPLGLGLVGPIVVIPLTFGPGADWCRNVLAAGGCSIALRGQTFQASLPELVDDVSAAADLAAAFGPFQRLVFRAMGTRHFLRLRRPG
jgi:deazaflavin-dependent oxidoreductase (nitroreductase family)